MNLSSAVHVLLATNLIFGTTAEKSGRALNNSKKGKGGHQFISIRVFQS
jgi:hypothetical protein